MKQTQLTYKDFGLADNPFPEVDGPIQFGGIGCMDLLKFGFYNGNAVIRGMAMTQLLPFAAALWHFKNGLGDMFSDQGTNNPPWDDGSDSFENAERNLRVFYYMMYLLGIEYWCWHDLDLVPFGKSLEKFHKNIDKMLPVIKELSDLTGIKVGWTTQNLFSHPRYTDGAATNSDMGSFVMGWAQTKKMLDVAKWLQDNGCGATHHTFWGGREGYTLLLATMIGREKRHLATFLWMAVRYAQSIGLKIQFQIEPKPKEPSTHQYDRNAEVVIGFLREFKLLPYFGLNIETNHAQLDDHSVAHELTDGCNKSLVTGIDGNQGTRGLGWDTDEFPSDLMICFETMFPILASKEGVLNGFLNFDAKRNRGSYAPVDLLYAHILGMDAMALGLALAVVVLDEGHLQKLIDARYQSWNSRQGAAIERYIEDPDSVDLEQLAAEGYDVPLELDPANSGHFEAVKSIVLRSIPRAVALLE